MKFEPQLLWQVYLDTIITVPIFFFFLNHPHVQTQKLIATKKIRGRKNKRNWAITSMGTATKRNERACHHRADTCIRDKLQIFHRMLVFRWSIMMGFLGLQNGLAADHVWHDFYSTITGIIWADAKFANKIDYAGTQNCTICSVIILHLSTTRKIGTNTKPIIQSLPLFPQATRGANSAISLRL